MPFARLTLIPAQPPERLARLTGELTSLIAGELRKRPDLTAILVETPPQAVWTIGGHEQKPAAHLEVCVTRSTNNEEEKQRFIAAAMALLRQEMPGLAVATYVVVKELPATDWGYDGAPQAALAAQQPDQISALPGQSRTAR